jgi:hypothetical protein
MRNVSIYALLSLAMTACMANGGSAAEQASEIRIESGPRLGAPRATHQLIAVGEGRLLAIGGCVRVGCEAGPASATVDIIDARSMELAGSGQLLAERIQPSVAALPGGRILIAGGYDGADVRSDAEIFDPISGRLSAAGSLGAARSGATATLLGDGRVLVAGGGRPDREPRQALASAELFDPATGRFGAAGTMARGRYKHGALRLDNGDILVVGGSDVRDYGGKLRSVERFDVAAGRFIPAGNLADPRFKIGDGLLLLPGNRVLVAAGDTAPEIFDVASGTGRRLDYDLGRQWNYMTLVRADAQTALLAGGYREGRIEPTDRSWIIHLPKG